MFDSTNFQKNRPVIPVPIFMSTALKLLRSFQVAFVMQEAHVS